MNTVEQITIVGGGTMGRGIARAAAQAGYETILCDLSDALVARALAEIDAATRRAVSAGRMSEQQRADLWDRLCGTADAAEGVASADLVIEAIPEEMELKQSTWRSLAQQIPEDAVLATNTSSLSIAELAAVTGREDRFLGMHFFNPVDRMTLLEIVTGPATSADSIDTARAVGTRMGKTAIIVKDSPGFATSRLGVALGLEAIRMLEEGVAGAAEIDTAMELGYRHPMGPLRLTDLVGLDVRLAIAEHLHKKLGSEVFRPPGLLRRMVADGNLGKKTGRGFYVWNAGE